MAKKAGSKKARRPARPARAKASVTFNHAMIYVSDLARAVDFYGNRLGFRLLARVDPVYARLRAPRGTSTIALHALEEGGSADAPGVRLYFEVEDLERFCKRLAADGVVFKQPPQKQPWGWTHAYLDDPDGHEISLYRAGAMRLSKS
jgi:catechol 2,3-dioxygenase-like lactoylglutathione lyase family enzyme